MIADLRLALRELETFDEPSLTLVALCDLASAYVDAGRPRRALAAVPRAHALCEALGEPVTRQQLRWTAGLARQALGQHERAEARLRTAYTGFLELGARGYAAVVALDLGIASLELGKGEEVARLAAGAIPVFESLRLDREAVAALELLRGAILDDAMTLPILRQARASLLASLRDPVGEPLSTCA